MDDFLKMDVFFVVTTAVVVLGGALVLTALFYGIKILRSLDHVMKNVSDESDELRKDIAVLREKVGEEGMRVKHLADFFLGMQERAAKRRAKKKVVHEDKGNV